MKKKNSCPRHTLQPDFLRCEYRVNPLGIDEAVPRLSWVLRRTAQAVGGCSEPPADGPVGVRQSAYRIHAASSIERLLTGRPDLWDSGIVRSKSMNQIAYAGRPLRSRDRCWWRVRVWDENGTPSPWSAVAHFSIGLLESADWQARWIGAPPVRQGICHLADRAEPAIPPSPLLRCSFTVESGFVSAFVYASALGVYVLWLNGWRVGSNELAPEWTDYRRRVQYQTYDVTGLLQPGENVLAAMLADGWYAGRLGPVRWDASFPRRGYYGTHRRLLLQLEITYSSPERRRQLVLSDENWRVWPDGPVRQADLFLGEWYDARYEKPGWDRPGFDDSDWLPVAVDSVSSRPLAGTSARRRGGGESPSTGGADGPRLVAQMHEPIVVVQRFDMREISSSVDGRTGVRLFDAGQNLAGRCLVRFSGPAGQAVTLRHGEMLDSSGRLYTANLGSAAQTDVFVHDGSGAREFRPHFTYHGFRYVEVAPGDGVPPTGPSTGGSEQHSAPATPPLTLTAEALSSNLRQTLHFECSNPLLNRLFENILWSLRSNHLGIPTDCPQRDERLGWLGDVQVIAQTAMFIMDMAAFYRKWLRDLRDAQLPDGAYPDFAPYPYPSVDGRAGRFIDAPGWDDAGVIVPWLLYVNYGDRRVLQEHYHSARRFMMHVERENPAFLRINCRGNRYGDWLNGDTLELPDYPKQGAAIPFPLFATAMWAQSAGLMAKTAAVLGKKADARHFRQVRAKIGAAFAASFVEADGRLTCPMTGEPADGQAGYALALHLDLLPEALRPKAVQHLLSALERYDWRLSTGFMTTNMLLQVLTRFGHNAVAYRLVESTRCPSWGYCIEQGATTLWERWDAYVPERSSIDRVERGIQASDMNSFNHYAFGSVGEWMVRTILGIHPDPAQPGYARVILRPQPGGSLQWARGHFDSIHGRISVAWERRGDRLELEYEAPPNVEVVLEKPETSLP